MGRFPGAPKLLDSLAAKSGMRFALQKRFPALAIGNILETPNHDYRYRLVIPKASWTAIIGELAQEQEWSNFKNEAAKYQGKSGRGYVDALHEVWDVMHRLQQNEERS